MRKPPPVFLFLFLFLFLLEKPLRAQDEVNPATKPGTVQITFLPPPMEGTVSLGIYARAGKLVRALKREAIPDKDFIVGLNGLITVWDGKDDQGAAAPKGVYSVRGYMVHAVEVSGEAFHGNDWIGADDAPHPKEITSLWSLPKDRLAMRVKLPDGSETKLECGLEGHVKPRKDADPKWDEELERKGSFLDDAKTRRVTIEGGKLTIGGGGTPLPELHELVDFSYGKAGSFWIIDRSPARVEVQQYSAQGEFLRRLSVAAGEPAPVEIAASITNDLIFLLEEAKGVQRVRGLALETLKTPLPADPVPEGEPKSSTWRVVFSRTIHACDDFATAAPLLGRPVAPKPETTLSFKLARNPLGKKVEPTLETTVVCEPTGSFLLTADGLPLCRLTETTGLKWAVLVRGEKSLSLLQSDGAVVEEYKIGKLTSMMAFDAGEYELK